LNGLKYKLFAILTFLQYSFNKLNEIKSKQQNEIDMRLEAWILIILDKDFKKNN